MPLVYSTDICNQLKERFCEADLKRPMNISRYEPGETLRYKITTIWPRQESEVTLQVEKFIGGGFAGQVYRAKLLEIGSSESTLGGLEVGKSYAVKIMIPPSGFATLFRNALYAVGFQGSFQLQVNPTAARAGAIWQKFIKLAACEKFGEQDCVNEVHATFTDYTIGSCGEISNWVEGRTWRLEVDDHIHLLKQWKKSTNFEDENLGSPEYRAKYDFMHGFVDMLHEMGAHEFARQYEWSTCKSQPNCLKYTDTEEQPGKGLVAVDFRAGLTLLPFLPMSPGDFKLIANGVKRGSLVQFDRGNLEKLNNYVQANRKIFNEVIPLLDELMECEQVYRDSVPDVTHNGLRLLYDGKLWGTMRQSSITGWKVRGLIDDDYEQKLRGSVFRSILFFWIGIIPILGRVWRKFIGNAQWRGHYVSMLRDFGYLKKAVYAKITERAINWHRDGRVSGKEAEGISKSIEHFLGHVPFSILPPGMHRLFTDYEQIKQTAHFLFIRPFKLYFNAELREQWLRDMIAQGQRKHLLSDDDAKKILESLSEPYIQKYLVSLVVHVLTLPLTQIVSVIVAAIFYSRTGNAVGAAGILILFQITPVSPGSFVRGSYVVFMMIKDRSFKDYNIAVCLGFLKYIGYLSFPIQMTYRYPALARFMAAHWATDAVHKVPVFGEQGALLEHWVYCLFYNWPLTIRRRMGLRAEIRKTMPGRYWHILPAAVACSAIIVGTNWAYVAGYGNVADWKKLWWLLLLTPILCGQVATVFAAGAALFKRIISAVVTGALAAIIESITMFTVFNAVDSFKAGITWISWHIFAFAVFAAVGAIVTELALPEPNAGKTE